MQDMNSNNKLKRKKKATGPGNPSKRHRDRLNAELDNLARLLPFPEEIVTKLDKISILRLTVSYLRAKSFFQGCNGFNGSEETCEDLVQEFEGNGMFSQLSLEALDGFICVITQGGQLFYVSENVRDFLGYSQAAVIHQSLFKFLHIDDQEMVKSKLTWPAKNEEVGSEENSNESTKENGKTDTEDNDKFTRAFTCRMKCTLNHGGGFYKLFKCVGRMREIHTKKRESKVTEYGLFAICSPAHNPNAHSTASVVKKEVAVTAQKRLERAQSDPLGNRRPAMAMHGGNVPRPLHLNPLRFPDSKSVGPSPLSSPTSSLDSGHPTPDSSQTSRNGTDADVRSDVSEMSNSSDGDNKSHERLLSAIRNQPKSPNKSDRRKAVTFAHPGSRDEDDHRKRSRSVADPSDVHMNDSMDPLRRSQMYRGSLQSLPTMSDLKSDDSRGTGELFGRKPLSSFDSRLDAARGLVSLGSMGMPYPGLFPFPDLMFPDMAFQRLEALHNPVDFARMRNPFDMHGCCSPGDSFSSMAMRRWLSSPDMFRPPMSPLISAQAGMLSAADRMRFFQYPFPYGFPFAGGTPFDMNAGLSEMNLPEYSLRSGLYRNGQVSENPNSGSGSKEADQERKSPKSPKNDENTLEESQKRKSPSKEQKERNSEVFVVKKEKLDNGCWYVKDDEDVEMEECNSPPARKLSPKEVKKEKLDSDEEENVDVVEPRSVCDLRQTLTGIQQEFTSRLENIKESFAQSLDGKFTAGTK